MIEKDRINEIDLLRFIAAISVVFFHYTFRGYAADSMSIVPFLEVAFFSKYGFVGVELFFMISGFVILMTASKGNLRSFLISRIVRLYPAFWVACTITFLVIIIFGKPYYSASFGQYLSNLTMFSGFFKIPSIDGVYWSLFVEIQFYFFIGLLLLVNQIKNIEKWLIGWLFFSVLFTFFHNKYINFIIIIDYSTYFISGAIFYLIRKNGLSLMRIVVLGVSLILSIVHMKETLIRFEQQYQTDFNFMVLLLIIVMFYVIFFLVALKRTGFIGKKKWIIAGAVTYPLYLLHQNIGFIIFNTLYPYIDRYLLLFIIIISMIFLSYFVHIAVEKKFGYVLKNYLTACCSKND